MDKAEKGDKEIQKSQISKDEEQVLEFWETNKIFEKSLEKPSPKGEYVFYDGPPFATGLPHYGHILAGTIKDAIPRYQTMRGHHVNRRWGWDCHGLPIEALIQKENNLNTKKDIEDFGVKKFNQAAKDSVFRYDDEWKKIVPRTGRWVDMDDQYTTMDTNFMESVWWGFKEIYKKGLAYEDFRSMHISPALETTLSNSEVGLNYKDITDLTVYAKFELEDDLLDEDGAKAGAKTYLIAWTTTPWTLFANVALAVGSAVSYSRIQLGDEKIIVATDLVEKVLKDKEYTIIEDIKGEALIGKSYKPVFDNYSKNTELENHKNGWKIYGADFVTTEDGTGIVHIAPAFGEDDLKLGQENNLPFVQHVNIDGSIKPEIDGFEGLQAKPAHDPTETDLLVLKKLAKEEKLFAKEKYTHSYPYCWRTNVPLLNYAMSSWFIKVTDYNQKMVAANKKVGWTPDAVGHKRFHSWLDNIRDWGISRSRYWGTAIPIWKSDDGSEIEVLGSIADIKSTTKSTNNYFVMRHGEADHNVNELLSGSNNVPSHLTDSGKEKIKENAEKLKGEKIDMIFASPLFRTQETAELIAEGIGLSKDKIITEDKIKELQTGVLEGKSHHEYFKFLDSAKNSFRDAPEGGESISNIRKRVGEFIYDIDSKYENKNILIVSHESPIWMLEAVRNGSDDSQALALRNGIETFISPGEFIKYDFAKLPHDDDYILDLHRPYIDDITFQKNGKEMKRIPDVFDGWVDSGSVPFAAAHYPFSDKIDPKGGLFKKTKGYPADFIAEGLDQTRGWFYTSMALNVAIFGKSPYKNVIVNGLVLAEDGQKISKSLKNYPDPKLIFDKYGADAMRLYLLSSQIVESEPLNFSEKGVDEVLKKVIGRLLNVVSFYELFKEGDIVIVRPESTNILDKWILARLDEVVKQTSESMEKYELNYACRPFADFVDDLSTWYVRRSRDRVKGDDKADKEFALQTIAYVLDEFSKVIAPFMPFVAEIIYQKVNGFDMKDSEKSVHLLDWSETNEPDQDILKEMKTVRDLVSFGLEARDKVSIKVRQPLQTLKIGIPTNELDDQSFELIKDEVNVKEIAYDQNLEKDSVELDSEISPELHEEGISRELIRFIQTLRKSAKLDQKDLVTLEINTNKKELGEKFSDDIKKVTNTEKINFTDSENGGEILEQEDFRFEVKIV